MPATYQTRQKRPLKPKIWSSAIIPEGRKDYIARVVWGVYKKTGRRPRKGDFNSKDYISIFNYFGSLKEILEILGLGYLKIERPWRKKPIEERKKRQKEYAIKWCANNKDKISMYRKIHIVREKARDLEGYLKKTREKARLRYPLRKSKQCPTCSKIILKDSPRCKSCTMRIRMEPKRIPYYKKCNDCDNKCFRHSIRCRKCAAIERFKQ